MCEEEETRYNFVFKSVKMRVLLVSMLIFRTYFIFTVTLTSNSNSCGLLAPCSR